MKKLDRFVLKSFIGPLILTFFIVLIILILQFLWMYVDELAGKGLEIKILAELLFQFSLSFVPMALPLAILLASLMTFGNMGEYSELTALKSSGIPLKRIMRSLVILVGFLSVVSFFFSISETAIIAISKIKLRHMLAKKVHHSESVQYLITHSDKFVVGILIGNNFSNISFSVIISAIFVHFTGPRLGVILATVSSTAFILVFCEILPKMIALKNLDV